MKRRLLLLVLCIAALSFTSGCATMFSGTTEPVTFASEPDGVTIKVNGFPVGKTPAQVKLRGKSDNIVEFSKDGYISQQMPMTTSMNLWVIANVLWCWACPLSTTTDYMTGAAYEYEPNKYYVTLLPVGSTLLTTPTGTQSKKASVKAFVVSNYGNILKEISSMQGENMKTLYAMLEIPEPDREKALEKIKAISKDTRDPIKFADDVVAAFLP